MRFCRFLGCHWRCEDEIGWRTVDDSLEGTGILVPEGTGVLLIWPKWTLRWLVECRLMWVWFQKANERNLPNVIEADFTGHYWSCTLGTNQSFVLLLCVGLWARHDDNSSDFSRGILIVAFSLAEAARVTGIPALSGRKHRYYERHHHHHHWYHGGSNIIIINCVTWSANNFLQS